MELAREVDARLFVFKRHVEGKDKGVVELLGHVGVSGTMVEHKTANESGVGVRLVLHLHNLDHMQINGLEARSTALRGLADGKNGIDEVCCKRAGQLGLEFGRKGGAGDGNEGRVVWLLALGNLELVQVLCDGHHVESAMPSKLAREERTSSASF